MRILDRLNIKDLLSVIKLMGKRKNIYLLCISLFYLVELLCTIFGTIGMKGIINGLTQGNMKLFWYSFAMLVGKHALWWIYAPISSYICSKKAIGTIIDIKSNLCEHIVKLPMTYHDKKTTGEYISLMSNDIANLEKIYDGTFFELLRTFIGGIGGVILMLIVDIRFALIVFTFGFLSIYVSSVFSKRIQAIGNERQTNLDKSSTDIYELVKASKTIRILNIRQNKLQNIDGVLNKEKEIKSSIGFNFAKLKSIQKLIEMLSYILLIIIGALFAYYKLSDWGTITALIGLKYITDMVFVESGQHMAQMQSYLVSVRRLNEINNEKEEAKYNNKYIINEQANSISLNNISFNYADGNTIINNFSYSLPKNCLAIILGESGQGKSTIFKLIMGLYSPVGGHISFDGKEKPEENEIIDIIRKKTAYVPQNPILFNGTIFENIAIGKVNATLEEVKKACVLAGADDFIEGLENGYDTRLTDDGNNLSGGQKSRIALARAIIKDTDILLLDEVTSALDKENENQIIETIKCISKQKTVLFITHNKDIEKYADVAVNMM